MFVSRISGSGTPFCSSYVTESHERGILCIPHWEKVFCRSFGERNMLLFLHSVYIASVAQVARVMLELLTDYQNLASLTTNAAAD